MSSRNNSSFYDSWFAKTRGSISFSSQILIHTALSSLRHLGFKRGSNKKILELGCGRGYLANKLSAYGKVTALDMAEKTLEFNKKIYPQVDFRVSDITGELGFDGMFDLAVSMEVIEHIPYGQQHKLIDNVFKALKPGGYFILTTPNKVVCEQRKLDLNQPVEDVLTTEQLRALLSGSFKVVNLFTVVYNFRSRIIDAIWKRLFYPINISLFQTLVRKTGKGKHIVVIAQKPSQKAAVP